MKYWFDTEFIEDGKTIDLVAIGIVAEDGREYYAQSLDANLRRADDWVGRNVFPHLQHFHTVNQTRDCAESGRWGGQYAGRCHYFLPPCPWRSRSLIARDIKDFCDPSRHGQPEFWAYYADYDWVALCQLFGRMIDLPKGWPMYCRDIKQWADMLDNPELPKQGKSEHHALADAKWNRQAWEFLDGINGR